MKSFFHKLSWFEKHPIITIISAVLISTFILYFPFITNTFNYLGFPLNNISFATIYQSYDGLFYIVPAKSWYNPKLIEAIRLEFRLPWEYYAAHLPLYPLAIALFSAVMTNLQAMIVSNLFFTVLLAITFYIILKKLKLTENPLLLTIVFLFIPRFLIIRSVGAPESLFIFLVLLSVFFFEKKNYLLAGLLGGLSAATKTPGILLFAAYGLVFIEQLIKDKSWKSFTFQWLWILLIPLGLLSVFVLYHFQYNDFFAYFHTGGVVPMPYPFAVFNTEAQWVGTPWLEDIILYFFIYLFSLFTLKDIKYRSFFYFPFVFFTTAIFVQHRDLSRYLLPILPFACIALEKLLTSKKFVIVMLILLPAIYLYAWNFLLYNIIPVADWRPFL